MGRQSLFSGTKDLNMKEFECSCQGLKDEKRSIGKRPVFQKIETRTDCKAKLKIGRKRNEEWVVKQFVIDHNHEMALVDQRHLLRSARQISLAKGATLKAMKDSGISISKAISYMEEEAGGPQFLGFKRKDAYDYLNLLSHAHSRVENGDASELVRHFKNKVNEEGLFYWDVQLDQNGRMMNFFFRDSQCRIDYECFGDVVSFDTTYKTNRYDMICAPFVGINHHRQSVTFGLAFLSDETTHSFEWLFNTFLESMGGKQPETIFTDQCQAMMNAIDSIFPHSCHRLCLWHISENAPSHFGSLNGDPSFKRLFNRCMQDCDSEEEFETLWKRMILDYNLSDHAWFKNMYKLRHKWATGFSNHIFSAGLKATSRSEGANSILKLSGNRTFTLYELVLKFEKMQNRWRQNEKEEDHKCRHEKPPRAVKNSPLLEHAASIYTHKVYHLFEVEYLSTLSIEFTQQTLHSATSSIFFVKCHGQQKVFKVQLERQEIQVHCSCKKFESMGILCNHVLLVYKWMNVSQIPVRYIKKRWTSCIRNTMFSCEDSKFETKHESEIVYVNRTMRWAYDLAMQSKVHEETRNVLTNSLKVAALEMNNWFGKLSLNETELGLMRSNNEDMNDNEDTHKTNESFVRNPLYVKPKGISNARMRKHWESKGQRRRRKVETSVRTLECAKKKAKDFQIASTKELSKRNVDSEALNGAMSTAQSFHNVYDIFQTATQYSQPDRSFPLSISTSTNSKLEESEDFNSCGMQRSFTSMMQF